MALNETIEQSFTHIIRSLYLANKNNHLEQRVNQLKATIDQAYLREDERKYMYELVLVVVSHIQLESMSTDLKKHMLSDRTIREAHALWMAKYGYLLKE